MTTGHPVAVLGAGSWGTALAVLLARNGRQVRLWGRNAEALERLQDERCNQRYLPGVVFPDTLRTEARLETLGRDCERFVVVVPSRAFRATLETLAPALQGAPRGSPLTVVWGTKGFDPDRGQLLSDVVAEVLGPDPVAAAISGPSFAREVGEQRPTALTVAARRGLDAERIARWFRNERTRVYTNTDLAGVQLGGAIKNVIAVAAGISDGLALGANARAALITRGLAELRRLGEALGGRADTFMGLTGLGDLILTCTDDQSRNRRLGLGIGRGQPLDEVVARIGQETEGIPTTRTLYQLGARHGVEIPITTEVYRVLFEGRSPHEAVDALLSREPGAE
jgi:glycerol-3-phosphate dehydrogenase (NAD(P)+)